MRAGDRVELRSAKEILATLDDRGCLEGVPFMPEMLAHFGEQYTVTAQVERACDTVNYLGVMRLRDTVILDDTRCNGTGHDGCGAQCRLYWKEAWLRPSIPELERLRGLPLEGLDELERRVSANTLAETSTPDDPVYRCQATELIRAGEPVSWYDIRSFLNELVGGNVGLLRWVYGMTRVVLHEVGLRLGLTTRSFSPFRPDQLTARSGFPADSSRVEDRRARANPIERRNQNDIELEGHA